MMRVSAVLLLLMLVTACGGGGVIPEPRDGAPSHTPTDLTQLPDPVPRKEAKSRYGNPASYTVNGRTYRVMDSAAGYVEEGGASWYGTKFHGRRTSSGEPYDMFQLTAAHRSLPIPSYVKVTRLDTGEQIVVRVNDRGPFHDERIIDLSYAAAVKLGFAEGGTVHVRVEALDKLPTFYLQAGAFSELSSADRLQQALATRAGVESYVVKTGADDLYRVRIGPVEGETEARRIQAMVERAQLEAPVIVGQ